MFDNENNCRDEIIFNAIVDQNVIPPPNFEFNITNANCIPKTNGKISISNKSNSKAIFKIDKVSDPRFELRSIDQWAVEEVELEPGKYVVWYGYSDCGSGGSKFYFEIKLKDNEFSKVIVSRPSCKNEYGLVRFYSSVTPFHLEINDEFGNTSNLDGISPITTSLRAGEYWIEEPICNTSLYFELEPEYEDFGITSTIISDYYNTSKYEGEWRGKIAE
ncbi:MAG: hypothetical protein IPL98_11205 [Saprospiraceae bacterium]|nr:hypothetical protein [Saprospiraceae bacterium]